MNDHKDWNDQQTAVLAKNIINVLYSRGNVTEELLPQIALPVRMHPFTNLNIFSRSFHRINLKHSKGLHITKEEHHHIRIDLRNRNLNNSSLLEGHRKMDIIVRGDDSLIGESL